MQLRVVRRCPERNALAFRRTVPKLRDPLLFGCGRSPRWPHMVATFVTTAIVSLLGAWASWVCDAGVAGFARFVAMNVAVCLSAGWLLRIGFSDAERSRRAVLWPLFAWGQIVLTCAVLGFAGVLTCDALVALNVLIAIGAGIAAHRLRSQASRGGEQASLDQPGPSAGGLGLAALAMASIAAFACVAYLRFGLAVAPDHADDLMHHLRFPVEWMKARRIFIVFAPFAFDAPSYAPCNAELFYMWLLMPLGHDLLAKVGQFPFLILGGIASYRLARQSGASPAAAVCGACVFMLSPAALRQSVSANVDVAFAAVLIACVSCLVDFYRGPSLRSLAVFAGALGLMVGTKLFAGLLVVCLLVAAAPGVLKSWKVEARRWAGLGRVGVRAALVGFVAVAFGGFWYVRNWAVTGSALFPMAVKMFGITVMPGSYDRSVMAATKPIDTGGLAPLLDALSAVFGESMLVVWVGLSLLFVGTLVFGRLRKTCGAGTPRAAQCLLVLAPWLYLALLWAALPYYSPNHFLPCAGLAGVLVATMLDRPGRGWTAVRIAVVMLAFTQMLPVPIIAEAAPVLGRRSLVSANGAAASVAIVLLAFGISAAMARTRRAGLKALRLATPVIVAVAGVWWASRPNAGRQMQPLVRFHRDDYGELATAWMWARQNLRNETIAYTGNCIVYPLLGPGFTNRLVYVNIDKHAGWKLHDYDWHERAQASYRPPRTEKPGYYRWRPDYDAWLANLRRAHATVLFIGTVPPLEVDYGKPDAEGFPIERAWAAAHPETFDLVFENDRAKVYRLRP